MQIRSSGRDEFHYDYFAREASQFPWVMKVALIGSVAQPLKKEVPRFREYRRRRIEVWHECKDIDVAVWVTALSDLNALRKVSAHALNKLAEDTDQMATVAHHQIDVFLLDYARNLYLGRLCIFKRCPNEKPECWVQSCGAVPFLQQHHNFRFYPEAVYADRIKILFDRRAGEDQTEVGSHRDGTIAIQWEEDDEIPF